MDDIYSPLLFPEDHSSDQRDVLREQFGDDPELAAHWARWCQVRTQLRQRFEEQISDRRLLVLYALDQEGRDDVLTAEERAALEAARDDIAEAIEAIPALGQVVDRIQDERADFEAVWEQHRDAGALDATDGSRRVERAERSPQRPSHSRVGTDRRWTWRLTVAALLFGAAVLAVFYGPEEASRTTVTAEADEQRIVRFEDGSTVRLVGATLSYTPDLTDEDERHVTLARGRAYFDVVSRDDASFIVNTPAAEAEALGTQFGVTTGSDTTEVVLVEGAVRVAAEGGSEAESVVLDPGERSTVRSGGAPTLPAPADLTATLEWTGLFVFRSTPTRALAQRLEEHYDVSVSVAPALADEPVTGTFERAQPVSEVLQTIAQTLGADVDSREGGYRLVPAS